MINLEMLIEAFINADRRDKIPNKYKMLMNELTLGELVKVNSKKEAA